ncbi:hypothetical protein FOMPIDRAFT_90074 [Fomitopsis schrenkii]|uniref:DUF6533 domain-containing protein n=1 Tax=Fomitopsis schrenkii TaxID=2126942 RepID=S8E394_FOMSC|nr:hypothetical protein FOMPIDRAFT_90074 [Fomitopsis schrenkii]
MATTLLGSILDDEQAMNYLTVFSLTLVLYDHILTFDAEIDYFWSGSWCLSRVLFLLGRYFPPIALV